LLLLSPSPKDVTLELEVLKEPINSLTSTDALEVSNDFPSVMLVLESPDESELEPDSVVLVEPEEAEFPDMLKPLAVGVGVGVGVEPAAGHLSATNAGTLAVV